MTTRFQDFLFKWSVAVVVFASIEAGAAVHPAIAALGDSLGTLVG